MLSSFWKQIIEEVSDEENIAQKSGKRYFFNISFVVFIAADTQINL
jgi:hypothetical protein